MPVPLHAPTRRELLVGSSVLFAWAAVPRLARAEGRDPRLVTIVLRGGLDGMVGDVDGIAGPRGLPRYEGSQLV